MDLKRLMRRLGLRHQRKYVGGGGGGKGGNVVEHLRMVIKHRGNANIRAGPQNPALERNVLARFYTRYLFIDIYRAATRHRTHFDPPVRLS